MNGGCGKSSVEVSPRPRGRGEETAGAAAGTLCHKEKLYPHQDVKIESSLRNTSLCESINNAADIAAELGQL